MAQINYDFFEDLTPEGLERVLDDLAAGRTPKPGSQIDRQFSAPVGGPTTLTDPELYTGAAHTNVGGPALTDDKAKRPGEAANVHEAAAPQPPAADSTAPRGR
jgi:NADH-quinone oxidoreductase subunit E